MKTPIKYPKTMIGIWFGLGFAAYEYTLITVACWIVFCFGAVGLYWLCTNRWNR